MALANAFTFSRQLGSRPISGAFVMSLLIHFALFAGLELGYGLGLWKASLISAPPLIQEVLKDAARRAELRQQEEQQKTPEAELIFIDVDPAQAAPEPPKDTLYYSSQNTRAANPDPVLNLEVPKIDGTQEQVPKTTDTIRPDPAPAPPAPQPAEEKPEPRQPAPPPREDPKPPGETLLARAAPKPEPQPAPPRPRPRTLQEARAQKGIIEGPKMKQKGGMRIGGVEGLDVKATPFGAYDAAFIAAVQARWFNLLDEREFVGSQSGKVVVEFNLNRDGRITEMRVAETEVTETLSWLCQRAIFDPAPYRAFPPDLRRLLGRDFRPVRFTFYYNQ